MTLKKVYSYALILFLDLCEYGRGSILWDFDLLKDYPITRSVFYSISTIFMLNLNTMQNMKHYSTRYEENMQYLKKNTNLSIALIHCNLW